MHCGSRPYHRLRLSRPNVEKSFNCFNRRTSDPSANQIALCKYTYKCTVPMKSPLCNTTRENPNPNPYPGKHVDASKSPHPSTDGGSGQKRRKGIFRLWTLGTEPRTFWFCFDDQTARLVAVQAASGDGGKTC